MADVAVLGLGAMGVRMAARLIAAGHAATVWNRSPGRAEDLAGVRVAGTPREAVAGASHVVAMLRDDAASRAVWLDGAEGALAGLRRDAVAIECSTLTPAWARELAGACARAGAAFLDAPVVGSRPQAEAGQLVALVGGEADVLARAEPVLGAFAAVHHVGGAGAGASLKLAVNALFALQVAGLAELIGLLDRAGLDLDRALAVMERTPVLSPAAKGAAAGMRAGAFAPLFPVELVRKDLDYALDMAGGAQARTPLTAAVRDVFARAAAAGYGADNLTGVVRLYR